MGVISTVCNFNSQGFSEDKIGIEVVVVVTRLGNRAVV